MSFCIAVSETAVVVSSIDVDKCFAYLLDGGRVKDLIECFNEEYKNMPVNKRELQKACVAFSSDGKLLAFNTNKGKLLSVWNTTEDWSLIENKMLAKLVTQVVFTPKTNVIVVSDKKGYVYALKEPPVRVLSHSSMILDVCFSGDEKYIITCDSDEKIRVSHYPDGKSIQYFFMGHKSYVSGICTLNNFVLSGAGDGTLRLWDLDHGELLDEFTIRTPVQSVVELQDMAVIQMYDSCNVHFIKPQLQENRWVITNVKTLKFENTVLDLASCGDQLWIIAGLSVYNYTINSENNEFIRNNNVKSKQIVKTLDNLLKSFVSLKNTDLMTFLYQRMMNKKKRATEFANVVRLVTSITNRSK